MLTAFCVVLLGAIVDILYAFLDPRIRLVAMSCRAAGAEDLLEVEDLHVSFATEDGIVTGGRRRLVHGRAAARSSAIVGESGSGKSVTRDDADGSDARRRTRGSRGTRDARRQPSSLTRQRARAAADPRAPGWP